MLAALLALEASSPEASSPEELTARKEQLVAQAQARVVLQLPVLQAVADLRLRDQAVLEAQVEWAGLELAEVWAAVWAAVWAEAEAEVEAEVQVEVVVAAQAVAVVVVWVRALEQALVEV